LKEERDAMPTTVRKRRTREHVIADLSINYVEKRVLQCGWTVQRINPDYGFDLFMTTFDQRGEIENGDVRFQVKATDSIKRLSGPSGPDAIAVRVEWRDVIFWLNERMPVILVIYDAQADRAWWIHLNPSLREDGRTEKGATLTIRIPLANRLNTSAVRRFRKFRDAAVENDV
jgi:hypothetical protein